MHPSPFFPATLLHACAVALFCVGCNAARVGEGSNRANDRSTIAEGGIREKAAMLTPGQIGLAAGIEALQAGEVLKGIEHLELVLENALDPRGEVAATAQGWLVHGYTRLGEPERALEHASIAIELVPDDAWLRYARGVALYTMGELEPAILAFSMAIERDAHHIKAWQWRAEAYYLRRRYDSAIADWGQALDILETTDQERLSGWRGQRVELLRGSLLGRARSYDASGEYEFARVDRERAGALLAARQR